LGGQVFFFFTQRGATRFDAMAMIALMVAFWIERTENPANRPALQMPVLYVMLGLQCCAGFMAWQCDFARPFTGSKQAADFIKDNRLNDMPMVGVTCDVTAIAAYLPKKIWFLCDGNYGSFCRWNDLPCGDKISDEAIRRMLADYVSLHGEAIFITQYGGDFGRNRTGKLQMKLLFQSRETIVRNSGYSIYKIAR
jgi:hypothetical protein